MRRAYFNDSTIWYSITTEVRLIKILLKWPRVTLCIVRIKQRNLLCPAFGNPRHVGATLATASIPYVLYLQAWMPAAGRTRRQHATPRARDVGRHAVKLSCEVPSSFAFVAAMIMALFSFKTFGKINIVVNSFLFDKNCPIMK